MIHVHRPPFHNGMQLPVLAVLWMLLHISALSGCSCASGSAQSLMRVAVACNSYYAFADVPVGILGPPPAQNQPVIGPQYCLPHEQVLPI